MEYLSVYLSHY